jgi:hypothetical protein
VCGSALAVWGGRRWRGRNLLSPNLRFRRLSHRETKKKALFIFVFVFMCVYMIDAVTPDRFPVVFVSLLAHVRPCSAITKHTHTHMPLRIFASFSRSRGKRHCFCRQLCHPSKTTSIRKAQAHDLPDQKE